MSQRAYPCEFCDTDQPQERKLVTIARSRHGKWYIFERVPAWVCPNCGHRYFDAEVVAEMDNRMQDPPADAHRVEAWAISLSEEFASYSLAGTGAGNRERNAALHHGVSFENTKRRKR